MKLVNFIIKRLKDIQKTGNKNHKLKHFRETLLVMKDNSSSCEHFKFLEKVINRLKEL